MSRLPFFVALVCLTVSCSDESPPGPSSPSPLITADSDRLWILIRASRVGDGRVCDEYYLNPNDPRFQGRAQQCDFWTRNFADYLAVNGFPTIEHQHLKEPVYWRWYLHKRQTKLDCLNALGTAAVTVRGAAREEHRRRKNQCDPYDDALNNQKLTPAELGIKYK